MRSITTGIAVCYHVSNGLDLKPESIDYIKPRDLIDFQEEIVEHKEKQVEEKENE